MDWLTPDTHAELLGALGHAVRAADFQITGNEAAFREAGEMRDEIATALRLIAKDHKAAKAPILAAGRKLDKELRQLTEPLEQAKSRLDQLRFAERDRIEVERAERSRLLDPEPGEIPASVLDLPEPPEPVHLPVRTTRVVEIVDKSLIPLDLMEPMIGAIRERLLAGQPVPGARLVLREHAC